MRNEQTSVKGTLNMPIWKLSSVSSNWGNFIRNSTSLTWKGISIYYEYGVFCIPNREGWVAVNDDSGNFMEVVFLIILDNKSNTH